MNRVIADIPKVFAGSDGKDVEIDAGQPVAHLNQRRDGVFEFEQLAFEAIDLGGGAAAKRLLKDLIFKCLKLMFKRIDDRKILIDDGIHQRVERKPRPLL